MKVYRSMKVQLHTFFTSALGSGERSSSRSAYTILGGRISGIY